MLYIRINLLIKLFIKEVKMTTKRPLIPAELKRKVLVEAGHRCAIPTCRMTTTVIHHIEPYAIVKEHSYSNLIALCPNCHSRVHNKEIDKKSIKMYKKKIVFLSDRYSKFELNVLDYLMKMEKNNKVCVSGYLLVKNLLDDDLIYNAHTIATFGYSDGTKELNEFVVALTKKGKKFVLDWKDVDDDSLIY